MLLDHCSRACAARIAHRSRTVVQHRRVEHVGQFVLVLGVHVNDVRNAAQVADVEEAVVCCAVIAAQTAAIHAEDDGKVLQADVVDDGIESPLQEGGINRTEGPVAACGHAGGEDYRMFLSNAHVEIFFWMVRTEEVERRAVGHGSGNRYQLLILVRELNKGVSEYFGVGALANWFCLSRFRIVGAEPMELLLLVERRLKSAALLRNEVQDNWFVLLLEKLKGLDQ